MFSVKSIGTARGLRVFAALGLAHLLGRDASSTPRRGLRLKLSPDELSRGPKMPVQRKLSNGKLKKGKFRSPNAAA